jgi:hypothetical protein
MSSARRSLELLSTSDWKKAKLPLKAASNKDTSAVSKYVKKTHLSCPENRKQLI